MKLYEFLDFYAGDGCTVHLLSSDGVYSDSAYIDDHTGDYPFEEFWIVGKVEYFDFDGGSLYISVRI